MLIFSTHDPAHQPQHIDCTFGRRLPGRQRHHHHGQHCRIYHLCKHVDLARDQHRMDCVYCTGSGSVASENQPIADAKPTLPEGDLNLDQCHGNIRFDHVSFTYPDTGIEALKDINLEAKTGERIAIVGKTASGKSSIAELLLGMYLPNTGEITIDGINIRRIDKASLRQFIGYVPQDVFLFSDTVTNNINFGAPDKHVEDAAVLQNMHQ